MQAGSQPQTTPTAHASESLQFCTTPEELKAMADEKTEPVPTTDAPSKCSTSSPLDSAIAPNYPKTWNLAIITFSLALGTFLVALDTLIVGIAIPTITSQFRSLDDIAWYGSAYLITLTAIQPSFGRVYKLYSAKATYLVCVAVFEGKLSGVARDALVMAMLLMRLQSAPLSALSLQNQQSSSLAVLSRAAGLRASSKAL